MRTQTKHIFNCVLNSVARCVCVCVCVRAVPKCSCSSFLPISPFNSLKCIPYQTFSTPWSLLFWIFCCTLLLLLLLPYTYSVFSSVPHLKSTLHIPNAHLSKEKYTCFSLALLLLLQWKCENREEETRDTCTHTITATIDLDFIISRVAKLYHTRESNEITNAYKYALHWAEKKMKSRGGKETLSLKSALSWKIKGHRCNKIYDNNSVCTSASCSNRRWDLQLLLLLLCALSCT